MSLYWPADPADVVLDAPRLHAVVVGVGAYPHLLGGVPDVLSGESVRLAADPMFLGQLTTTPLTAKRIADWLAGGTAGGVGHKNLECPIGSVELLLSPEETVATSDGRTVDVERATMEAIRTAVHHWVHRCDAHAGNTALFYFAGHGISTSSVFLLPADFGADPYDYWGNSIDFDGLNRGLRNTQAHAQVLFVDACREFAAANPATVRGDPLISYPEEELPSSEGVYFASQEGHQAYGPVNDITYFAQAVLAAFEGVGAENTDGAPQVDHGSLGNAIPRIMQDLPVLEGKLLTSQNINQGPYVVLHRPAAKLVRTSVRCVTAGADAESALELRRGAVTHRSDPGDGRPWTGNLEAGDWEVRAAFENFPAITSTENLSSAVQRVDLRHP